MVGEDGYVRGRMEGVERNSDGRGKRQRRHETRGEGYAGEGGGLQSIDPS